MCMIWFQFLFLAVSFYVGSGEDVLQLVDFCSREGLANAQRGRDCVSLTLPSNKPQHKSQICIKAAQIACAKAKRDRKCEVAVEKARELGKCPRQTVTSSEESECCEACLLGTRVASSGMKCNNFNTQFGPSREAAFRSCCNTPNSPSTGAIKTGNCRDGFRHEGNLTNICHDIDECVEGTHECNTNQRCVNTMGSYKCIPNTLTCAQGLRYNELTKECEDIDECAEGTSSCDPIFEKCVNTIGSHTCIDTNEGNCPQGYRYNEVTKTCEETSEERNICIELQGELCAHLCHPTLGSYRCTCRPGFRLMSDGKTCIAESRCGRCTHGCSDSGDFICNCPPPFIVAPDKITCIKENEQLKAAICSSGYRLRKNQTDICEDIDECEEGSNTCEPNTERCVNSIGSFNCIPDIRPQKCSIGFRYNETARDCQDIDECITRRPCNPTSEKCINTIGSYNCVPKNVAGKCSWGFRYNEETDECDDIDECKEEGEDPACDSNQICQNTLGSFQCNCKTGFRRDTITYACVDINECQINTHECATTQRCDNTIGSYVCIRDVNCGTGYTLNHQTGQCEDDNECELATDTCRYLGKDWECRNTPGSFRCVRRTVVCSGPQCDAQSACKGRNCTQIQSPCPAGFTLHDKTCRDINECEEGKSTCNANQRCVNLQGSYMCYDQPTCKSGFKMNSAKTRCIDVNECQEQEGLCSHFCDNRWGSFSCRCRPGFFLHTDNRTCMDINECELGVRCQGFCTNQQGSYTCGCPPGYRLGMNRHSCEDINECESTEKVCQEENEICINLSGSYRCNAVVCPAGYHRDPSRRTRCQRDNPNCRLDDEDCKRQPVTFTYNFITMQSNYSIPSSGFLQLFTVESGWGSMSSDFKLDLIQARVPPGIPAATIEYFNLNKQYRRATIELLKPLLGPQEIQLELKTEFFNSNVILGVSVFSLEIFVSQYSY